MAIIAGFEPFSEKIPSEFWREVYKNYPSLGQNAVMALLPVGSTHLCRNLFCHALIQTNQRKCYTWSSSSVLCHLTSTSWYYHKKLRFH